MALDETCMNGLTYWVYQAVDGGRNGVVYARAYPTKKHPHNHVVCWGCARAPCGGPAFVVDRAPCYALGRLGLTYIHQTRLSLAESAFYSAKQRTFNTATVNLRLNPDLRWRRTVSLWNLFCKTFTHYYNSMRG